MSKTCDPKLKKLEIEYNGSLNTWISVFSKYTRMHQTRHSQTYCNKKRSHQEVNDSLEKMLTCVFNTSARSVYCVASVSAMVFVAEK